MAIITKEEGKRDLSGFVWAVYALQLLTPFTGGISFLASGIIAYFKHDESIGTLEESHFTWQIKTFWIGISATIIGIVLLLIWIGIYLLSLTELWIIYRVIKGGYYYSQKREMHNEGIF